MPKHRFAFLCRASLAMAAVLTVLGLQACAAPAEGPGGDAAKKAPARPAASPY